MNVVTKGKAPQQPTAKAFKSNHFVSLDGNENSFDIFHSTEKANKTQCHKCFPPLIQSHGTTKVCVDCEQETKQTAQVLFENLQRNRKIHRADRHCFGCNKYKTTPMMSRRFKLQICKSCADEWLTKGATARNNSFDRATNNFYKNLREAAR